MYKNLEIFRMAHAMARHAGVRQGVVAQNIANADTPGYAARDLRPFSEVWENGPDRTALRATRVGHLGQPAGSFAPRTAESLAPTTDPNGNSVSLESEMLKGVEVKRQHDRALAIYRSSLTVLRTALGRA